jgi:hypothetical protein
MTKGNEVSGLFSRLQTKLTTAGYPSLVEALQNLQNVWLNLKTTVPQGQIDAPRAFEEHSVLIRQTRQFIASVVRAFNMNYLQSAVSYNLTISSFVHLPALTWAPAC